MRKGIIKDYLLLDYPSNSFDYFIDIGGCAGYFTDGVLETNPQASVVIYEPFKDAYEWICKKFEPSGNVRVVNCALGDGNDLFLKDMGDWNRNIFVKEDTGKNKIGSKLLSDIISESGILLNKRCGIKIDAEGGEWNLLSDPRIVPLLQKFMYIGIEIHFPPRTSINPQFSVLPPWKTFDKWINTNFTGSHNIKYHRSDSAHGHGMYILTRNPFEPQQIHFKNCIVGNLCEGKRYKSENIERLIKAQIENSIELGWSPKDIILISNFEYEFMGVTAIPTSLNKQCLTGSKIFGMKYLFDNNLIGNNVIWSHDLDAWQNIPFEIPFFKDVGIVCYSNAKYNGGSIFWGPNSGDIVQEIVRLITTGREPKEEPTLNAVLKSPQFADRVTVLNNTFNVGCSGYVVRYDKSIKPLRVCHFHPYNRLAWETHALDRNGLNLKGISDRLEKTIRKYYPDLPTELPEDGKKTQAERRENREKGLPVKPPRKKKHKKEIAIKQQEVS